VKCLIEKEYLVGINMRRLIPYAKEWPTCCIPRQSHGLDQQFLQFCDHGGLRAAPLHVEDSEFLFLDDLEKDFIEEDAEIARAAQRLPSARATVEISLSYRPGWRDRTPAGILRRGGVMTMHKRCKGTDLYCSVSGFLYRVFRYSH
jgi:hypothetical protein